MDDIITEHDVWMLPPGEYELRVSLFSTAHGEIVGTVKQRRADVQVTSKNEARYIYNQVTDLMRKAGKLGRAHARLFPRETR